jgi:acyl-coenzyme A thioesterase PaaI-like protein
MSLNSHSSINNFDLALKQLKEAYHSQCVFQCNAPADNLRLRFIEDGTLTGTFLCSSEQQGYDGIVHGGVIAAIIDASMTQCCMGHGFVAYTADLCIRYRLPIRINTPCLLETRIVSAGRGVLFSLECKITQEGQLHVEASGRFFRR